MKNKSQKSQKSEEQQRRKPLRTARGYAGFVKLSKSTVEKIGNQLHEHIQFYDEHGQPANAKVIQAIEDSLSGAGQPA